MCGRYAASANPEDLVEEFEVELVELRERPEPDYNVAPTKPVPVVITRRDRGAERVGSGRTPPAGDALGAHPVLGQGHQDRQPADQREGRDRGGEARVSQGPGGAAVPAARGRLLRVVLRRRPQAALLHPSGRPSAAGDGRPLRAVARLDAGARGPGCLGLVLHRPHHRGGGRRRAHPRPHADDGRARQRGRTGSTRTSTTSTPHGPCWCPPRPASSRPIRCRPGSTRSTTTASTCSTRWHA